jgi:hypothetical protein
MASELTLEEAREILGEANLDEVNSATTNAKFWGDISLYHLSDMTDEEIIEEAQAFKDMLDEDEDDE